LPGRSLTYWFLDVLVPYIEQTVLWSL
jgi:hypothetical protein